MDLEPDFGRRFEALTALLFATLGWLYFVALRAPEPVPGTDDFHQKNVAA